LGEHFDFAFEIEVISKPRQDYQTTAYAERGLPKAPAIMLEERVLVAGRDIDETDLLNIIKEYQDTM